MRDRQVYFFSVLDKDPESLTFGCVADTIEHAQLKAAKAGYKEVVLLEVRNLALEEDSFFINEAVYENPVLGPVWLPVVDEYAEAAKGIKIGEFLSLQFLAKAYNYGHGDSPYVQGMYEGDGSLHFEVGSPDLIEGLGESGQRMLEFLGWSKPQEGDFPNYVRVFEPGWNIRNVVYFSLLTFVIVFDIEPSDLILASGPGLKNFGALGKLEAFNEANGKMAFGEAFGIPGINFLVEKPIPFTAPDDETPAPDYETTAPKEDSAYQQVDQIFSLLENNDLASGPGAFKGLDVNDKHARGLKGQCSSSFVVPDGDDYLTMYYTNVEIFEPEEEASVLREVLVDSVQPGFVGVVAGANWIAWLETPAGIENVDKDTLELFVKVLGGRVLVSRLN